MKYIIPLVASFVLSGCVTDTVKQESASVFFDCVDNEYVRMNPDNGGDIREAVVKAVSACEAESLKYALLVTEKAEGRSGGAEGKVTKIFNPMLHEITIKEFVSYYKAHASN